MFSKFVFEAIQISASTETLFDVNWQAAAGLEMARE
jgi:hypothetical protein